MRILFKVLILLLLASCASTYSHRSGNNSNLDADSRYCSSQAKLVAPVYLCRNPLMCAPDEVGTVWTSIAQNDAAYDQCMQTKGYTPN
ncbi:MAG: hypothetical protein O3C64_05635 [Proteobacteria bacterium]|jgi:hypothetical protein|nr:hypothetical protein [Pseudomonadota bacterium]